MKMEVYNSLKKLLILVYFARVVILKEGNMIPLDSNQSLEKIKNVRREAKEKVFCN